MNHSLGNMSASGNHSQLPHTEGAFTATLKGKITGLEETIKALQQEIHFYNKEIKNLRSEKESLDDQLTRKA